MTSNNDRLKGKCVVITGGAAGIGAAIVRRFVQEGCNTVLFVDIDDIAGKELEQEINNTTTANIIAHYRHCDVSKENDVKTVIEEFFGNDDDGTKCIIDIVINNAAIFTFGKVEDVTENDWDKIFSVNVKGYCWIVKYTLPYMKRSTAPSIVNIGSISSYIAQPEFVPYNTCKGAVLQLTRCLAIDLIQYNIRVNIVCPGGIHTAATERHAKSEGKTIEQVAQELSNLHLIPRMGKPEEVANAVLFLASDEASFITGTSLMVDGGWTAK